MNLFYISGRRQEKNLFLLWQRAKRRLDFLLRWMYQEKCSECHWKFFQKQVKNLANWYWFAVLWPKREFYQSVRFLTCFWTKLQWPSLHVFWYIHLSRKSSLLLVLCRNKNKFFSWQRPEILEITYYSKLTHMTCFCCDIDPK